MKLYRGLIFFGLLSMFAACNNKPRKHVIRDTSITPVTSFNNLFLDSAALHAFLEKDTVYRKYQKQFGNFYKQRNYEYAWFDSSGMAEQAKGFINLLNNTIDNLQDSSLYNPVLMGLYMSFADTTQGKAHSTEEVLNTELLLTGQFFSYAAKVYKGTDSNITDLGWFIPRKKIDLTALLDSVIITKNKIVNDVGAVNVPYNRLSSFLPFYYQLQKQGNWDSLPPLKKSLHINESADIIATIKDRLQRLGDLVINDSTTLFDSALFGGVKKFQKRMGLAVDGVIGAKMIDDINTSPADRIRQILVNLERMRWMPPAKKEYENIFVNIPEYKMYVYDSGKLSFNMNVIVGTAANSTTIFSGDLKYIVFAPYWNLPPSIVRKEVIPGIQKNPDYLAKNNMEKIGGSNALPSIRQKPGPGNALGKVKFLFPNNYDIYFHDTPNRNLFSASSRSFSHGCIRVGEPKKLAQFLLRNDSTWTDYRIDTSMNSKKEKWVTLARAVPVTICYFTAFVDDDGMLNFRKDIYGHDAILADKLFAKQ